MPSSVIAAMKYDRTSFVLTIRFVSGLVYNYKDVPEEVFNSLKTSSSKGAFLNQHIKGKYQFEKIDRHLGV